MWFFGHGENWRERIFSQLPLPHLHTYHHQASNTWPSPLQWWIVHAPLWSHFLLCTRPQFLSFARMCMRSPSILGHFSLAYITYCDFSYHLKSLNSIFLCSSSFFNSKTLNRLPFLFPIPLYFFPLDPFKSSLAQTPLPPWNFLSRWLHIGKSNSQFLTGILLCLWAACATMNDPPLVWIISCISRPKFTAGLSLLPISQQHFLLLFSFSLFSWPYNIGKLQGSGIISLSFFIYSFL